MRAIRELWPTELCLLSLTYLALLVLSITFQPICFLSGPVHIFLLLEPSSLHLTSYQLNLHYQFFKKMVHQLSVVTTAELAANVIDVVVIMCVV